MLRSYSVEGMRPRFGHSVCPLDNNDLFLVLGGAGLEGAVCDASVLDIGMSGLLLVPSPNGEK